MRTKVLVTTLLLAGFIGMSGPVLSQYQYDNYQSPYRVEFSYPPEELYQPDQFQPRNNPREEASVPFDEWYSVRTRKKFGAWGPVARRFPPLQNYDNLPASWKRQRLLAVAVKYIGLPYQHHHIPDWDPPRSWPWKQVAFGRNSKGVDCSDFSSWIYNYGLGIKLKTGIKQQALDTQIPRPGGDGFTDARVIRDDNGYDTLIRQLKTGDLLYIKNNQGELAHVIMWVGDNGVSPDGAPLVIDSTGSNHYDSNNVQIPIGIHLRPFLKDSWYYRSFSHAHRLIREES